MLVGLAALLLLLTVAATAEAAVVRKRDTVGDAPAAYDIRWARYSNANPTVAFTVKIRHLTSQTMVTGEMNQGHREDESFESFEAWVWKRPDGTVATELRDYPGTGGYTVVPCSGMTASWRTSRNTVRVAVPRSCLGAMTGRMYMRATATTAAVVDSSFDGAPGRWVRQG